MKKVILGIAILASVVACKKDDKNDDSSSKTTREKIIGIWLGDKQIDVYSENGNVIYNDTTDLSGLQFDFRNDGNVYLNFGVFPVDTGQWTLNGDSKILIDGEEFDIVTLTDTDFHARTDSTYTGGGVTENYQSTTYLKR